MTNRRLPSLIRAHWFLLALCTVLVVGAVFSNALQPLSEAVWLRNLLVASVLFVTALPVQFEGMKETVRSPGAVLLACAVSWVVIPLLVIPFAIWRADALGIGLMVAAAAPGTLASAAVWTRTAKGNELIPIAVTLITNPLSCLVIPFWIGFVTSSAGVSLNPIAMTTKLALLVVLPMALAQVTRQLKPVADWASRRTSMLSAFALCGVLTIVFIGAIQCGIQLSATGDSLVYAVSLWPIVLITAGVHLCALFGALVVANALGFEAADRIGIAFAGSQKTLMVGIQVAFMLGGGLIVIPMVVYHALQLVIDAWLANRWARVRCE